jgi:hypothetical protein
VEKTTLPGALGSVLLTKYFSGDQIEMNEMGRSCHTNGERRCTYRVLVGKPEEKDHFKDLGVNGRILLNLIFRKWDGEE